MSTNKHPLRIILIFLSVFLIASFSTSCIKIVHEGEQEPSEQAEDNNGINRIISIVKTLTEKVKDLSTQKDAGLVKLPQSGEPTNKTRPHPPVRTGEIALGTTAILASQPIGASGGTVSVARPGDPLDGFVISVPPSSFSANRTFKVSSAPITSHTFGSDITPISPMITVDNGGGYSENIMYVRVPVKVPDGYFAMGFIYDNTSRQLEGIPLVGIDNQSVTIATRHFSSLFISMIEKTLLKNDTDSGFRPGIDDWQFTNYGSYIAPGGHCEGQSLTALWYYCTSPDGKDACLFNRYDNNGNKPATPELWQDDSIGYRLCSTVQKENRVEFSKDFWTEIGGKQWKWENNKWNLKDVPGIGDEATYNLFAYSIRATGEPQEVVIWSNGGAGHAMIVYKIVGNALYIADPNYPGSTDRKIIYYSGEGKFKPYNSGANRKAIDEGKGISFENILYAAKSTIVPWDKIAQRWTEFKNGSIGNDKFPKFGIDYKINVVDDSSKIVELTDGFSTKNKLLRIGPSVNTINILVYRDSIQVPINNDGKIELEPGDNLLGVWIRGRVNNSWEYVDFKYFNVKYEADVECKTPPPANILSKLQRTTKFNCELLNLPTNIEGHGSMNKWVPGFKFTKHFYVPGNAVQLGGDGTMPITWSGTTFSGGGSKEYPDMLKGSICYNNGYVLVSFDYQTNNPVDDFIISVKNLPVDPKYFMNKEYDVDGKSQLQYTNTDASEVKKYVTRLEWKSHEERVRYGGQVDVWDASLISADWSNRCGFVVTFKE